MKAFQMKSTAVLLGLTAGAMFMGSTSACTRAFLNQYPGYMVSARNLDFLARSIRRWSLRRVA
ncbi:hypothetical protein QNH14_05950 [Apirhabdus apintestini]|nr:hypothetical protein QNH14_05950 [Enterobacteriaceae bacterium CA-0114]